MDNREAAIFCLILLVGICARADLWLLPMNDELLYAGAAVQKFEEHFARDSSFRQFYMEDIVESHPIVPKLFMAAACFAVKCNYPVFENLHDFNILSVPTLDMQQAIKGILPAVRSVNLLFSLLFALIGWHFTRKEFEKEAGLVAFGILMLSPNFVLYANSAMQDMIYITFLLATALFYTSKFYDDRSWKNTAILAVLMTLMLASKRFIPWLAIFALIGTEALGRKLDKRVVIALICALLAFYALDNFISHSDNSYYARNELQGSFALSMGMISIIITRLDLLTLPLLLFALWFAFEEWCQTGLKKVEVRNALFLVLMTLPLFAFGPGRVVMRYALGSMAMAAIVAAAFVRKIPEAYKIQVRWVIIGLGVLAVLALYVEYPYYDNYHNGLTKLFGNETTERTLTLPVLPYLQKDGNKVTNDVYSLPYYSKTEVQHTMNLGLVPPNCGNYTRVEGALKAYNASWFFYRETAVDYLYHCDELPKVLARYPVAFNNSEWVVYDLR